MRIVLASRSPRRIEILSQMGVDAIVEPADIDETPVRGESATEMVLRLAVAKATVVSERRSGRGGEIVLAADTTVEIDDEILGQPVDDAEAARMLRRLSGRTHRVHTAVAVVSPDGSVATALATSLVTLQPVTDETVAWYVEQGSPGARPAGTRSRDSGPPSWPR